MTRFRNMPAYRPKAVNYDAPPTQPYGPPTITVGSPLPQIYMQPANNGSRGGFYSATPTQQPNLNSRFFTDPFVRGSIAF